MTDLSQSLSVRGKNLFNKLWIRFRRELGYSPDKIEAVIAAFGRAFPHARFVQVGANDGSARDPLRREIRRRQWRGLMIEPVPYVFNRLRQRYGVNARIQLAQVAIAEQNGERSFYHLREAEPGDEVWQYYHALGSFRRDVLLSHRHLIPDIDERVVETRVECATLTELCMQKGLVPCDLLFIDTEGYDFEILKTVDFERLRPKMIVYEHVHLSDADRHEALALLVKNGYSHFSHGLDTAALDASLVSAGTHPKLSRFFPSESQQLDHRSFYP